MGHEGNEDKAHAFLVILAADFRLDYNHGGKSRGIDVYEQAFDDRSCLARIHRGFWNSSKLANTKGAIRSRADVANDIKRVTRARQSYLCTFCKKRSGDDGGGYFTQNLREVRKRADKFYRGDRQR